jgi:hypothetical protein
MKKTLIIFTILGICSIQSFVFANEFSSLSNLTPEQSAKLSKIHNMFKQQNDELENQIMIYTDKISKVKSLTDKTQSQITLMTSTFEKNIEALKAKQDLLKTSTDKLYKEVLTIQQYQQYQAQQLRTENAFSDFLRK